MKNKEKLTFTVVAMLVMVVGLSVAYAALSTTLNVTVNPVTSNVMSWTTGWSATCTKTESSTSSSGKSCGAASISNGVVTIAATTLSKPGDYCHYACTITNTGSIGAKLTGVTIAQTPTATSGGGSCSTSGTTITCKNSGNTNVITYKISKNDTCTSLYTNSENISIAASSGTQPVYICVDYVDTGVQSTKQIFSAASYSIALTQN